MHDAQNRLSGRMITLHDVTARKLAEQELGRARDAALEASQFKSELLARVSHELRTPLECYFGIYRDVAGRCFWPPYCRAMGTNPKIIDSTGFLTRQVNELLDLSRLEMGQLQISAQEMSVREVTQAVHTHMVHLAEAKKVQLFTEVQEDVPAIILSDPDRLTQILLNLVGNAIKFSDEGVVRQIVSVADGRLFLQVRACGLSAGVGRERLMRDMDAWGYSFRLGQAARWFATDADDALEWLRSNGLVDNAGA
ncbi:MAG: hypothetical protein HC804_13375, partial [Anaerolineae bacterium]|nr:hypothetical protein [Anaerolineae bacterium]